MATRSSSNSYQTSKVNSYAAMVIEQRLVLQHFSDFIKSSIVNSKLRLVGKFRPTSQSEEYKYTIDYSLGSAPVVRILSHELLVDHNVHVYKDGSLCLYWPKEWAWNEKRRIFDTIIPWVHGWIVFYEIYLQTGKWEHPEIKH